MVLHELKLAETKGSGIRVMRDEMEIRGLSPPLLDSDRTGNQFICQLLFHHFLGDADIQWLASLGLDLSDEQRRAMVQAREVGAIDNSTYRGLNRDSDTLDASRHLRRLCDLGLLETKGKGVKTYYVPTKKGALANWPPETPKSPKSDGKSPDLGLKSPEVGAQSPALPIPVALRAKLDRLGGKAVKDTMVDAVLELLQWRELTLDELAKFVGRTPDHVRKTYLKDLIQADLVRPMAASPNDPNQTYRATKMISIDDEQPDQ